MATPKLHDLIQGLAFAPKEEPDKKPEGTDAESALEDALAKSKINFSKDVDREGRANFSIEGVDRVVRINDSGYLIDADAVLLMAQQQEIIDFTPEEIMKNMKVVMLTVGETK